MTGSIATARKAVDRQAAAEMYGVSFDTIKRAINAGTLRAKRSGRRILVDLGDLAQWYENLPDA